MLVYNTFLCRLAYNIVVNKLDVNTNVISKRNQWSSLLWRLLIVPWVINEWKLSMISTFGENNCLTIIPSVTSV